MPDIILATQNAKYIHAAFGLRYLMANLGELRGRAALREFDIHQRPADVAAALLGENPRIIGLGIYIWNVAVATELVAELKRRRPEVKIILGGPEVSHEWDRQRIVELADHVITGEADLKFAEVCGRLLAGEEIPKIIPAELPKLEQLASPYEFYTDDDAAHRVIYVEASRGCPFSCEFCLSSLDVPVRQFPLPELMESLEKLMGRGVRQFKFVDRTFNLNPATSGALLEFFLKRQRPGLFAHFEMIPDRLPEALRGIIARFPPGALQFEVGVQTFNPEVSGLISRRQDYGRLAENFRFLRSQTGVHVHADLIAGLPGETLESFGAGFDRLIELGPQEIQVGMLKRLRGTPIVRHDEAWGMVYDAQPPYEIRETRLLDAATVARLKRFSRYWDLIGNSGNFLTTTPRLWSGGASPFAEFMGLSDWLHGRLGRQHGIALTELAESLFEYLTVEKERPVVETAVALLRDYQTGGRRDVPVFLRSHVGTSGVRKTKRTESGAPKRQRRHLAGGVERSAV
jgi:radical SAM superfamily enzyme YgiQ (UPF0313 family)